MPFLLSDLINKFFHKSQRRDVMTAGIFGDIRVTLYKGDIQMSMDFLKLGLEFLYILWRKHFSFLLMLLRKILPNGMKVVI